MKTVRASVLSFYLLMTIFSCRLNSIRPEAVKTTEEEMVTNGPWNLDTNRLAGISWPGGKARCLVLSFDDGLSEDRLLVALFNKYHLKGTFHLNSGRFGQKVFWLSGHDRVYVTSNEVASLYAGHEIACHTVNHPDLPKIPLKGLDYEVGKDRSNLENLAGYEVHGLAYPMGLFTKPMLPRLDALGIHYARTVKNTGKFWLPSNLLTWNPTTHFQAATNFIKRFFDAPPESAPLFFIWGHSWEIGKTNDAVGWKRMDDLCASLSGHDDTWYASCIEVSDYLKAANALSNLPSGLVTNPSHSVSVWRYSGSNLIVIAPGETAFLPGGVK
jgi:peptidoglycan/xylan/chitin deacetylase (PgdA/CDA1 family)